MTLDIRVVTLFPEALEPFLRASIPGRVAEAGLARYRLVQLRDFTHDRHRTVDDYPFGGGAGMVLKPVPPPARGSPPPRRTGPA